MKANLYPGQHAHEPVQCAAGGSQELPVYVVLLRNALAPYEVPWLRALEERVEELNILASEDGHPTLPWETDQGQLKVVTQSRLAMNERQNHPAGFVEAARVHIPYGTFSHLRRLKPNVIISSELGARTLQALAYSTFKSRVPIVVYAAISERTEEGRGKIREVLRRFLIPRVDAVVTPGKSGARYLERLGAHPEDIFVVPRTTDPRPFLGLPLTRSAEAVRRLFFPGQFIQRKGLLSFLDVLCRWATRHSSQNVELCLLGNGPEQPTLEAYPRPPNLAVRFSGGVPYAKLPPFYGQAGILVFPTLADEWGLVVNEALASGVPVLGSRYSQAVEELITEGVNGWTFRPDNPEETYMAINRALSAPDDQLGAMRVAARRSVERITPQLAADRVLLALRFALSHGRDRHPKRDALTPRRRANVGAGSDHGTKGER